MPLGLDFKSVAVGILLAYFVVPYIMSAISSRRASTKTT